MSADKIEFELVLGEGELAEESQAIENAGGVLREPACPYEPDADEIDDLADSQFEPLMMIAASLAAGYLVKTVSSVWLDHKRSGGQVVDARGAPVRIKRVPYVDRGKLVIITENGTQVFSANERVEGEKVLASVLTGAKPI
jgi:hypothetical protein